MTLSQFYNNLLSQLPEGETAETVNLSFSINIDSSYDEGNFYQDDIEKYEAEFFKRKPYHNAGSPPVLEVSFAFNA